MSIIPGREFTSGEVLNPTKLNLLVPDAEFDDGAITTSLISDGAITENKIADAAVSSTKFSISGMYPVGSVYMNAVVSTNPATLLGFGTWVRLNSNTEIGSDAPATMIGEDGVTYSAGSAYGTKLGSHTHTISGNADSTTLTAAQSGIGSHNHTFTTYEALAPDPSGEYSVFHQTIANAISTPLAASSYAIASASAAQSHNHGIGTCVASTENGLPSSFAINIWIRTA